MMKHLFTAVLALCTLMYPPLHASGQDSSGVPLTQTLLAERIARLEAAGEPPEDLLTAYIETQDWLRERDQQLAHFESFRAAAQSASEEEQRIRERINAIEHTPLEPEALSGMPDEALDAMISQLQDDLAAWTESRAAIDRRIGAQASAGETILARLKEIDERLALLPPAGDSVILSVQPSLQEVTPWLQSAEYLALNAERQALKADQESQPVRNSRRFVEREEASTWISLLEADLSLALAAREERSDNTVEYLQSRFPQGTPGRQVLLDIAARRADAINTRNLVTKESARAESYRSNLQNASLELQRNYDSTVEIVNAGGDSSAFGPLLISYQRQLDRGAQIDESLQPALSIGDLIVARNARQERLYQWITASGYVDQALEADGAGERAPDSLRKEAIALAREEREVLTAMAAPEEKLLSTLREIQLEESRLASLRGEFGSYLQGHILWVRSQTPVYQNFTRELAIDMRGVATLAKESRLDRNTVWSLLLALLLVMMLATRKTQLKALEQIALSVNRPRSDSVGLTLRALFHCLWLAAPGALLVAIAAVSFKHPDLRTEALVWHSLLAYSALLLLTTLLLECARHDVLSEHFHWPEERLRELGRASYIFGFLVGPIMLLAMIVAEARADNFHSALGQASLLLAFGFLGFFLWRLVNRHLVETATWRYFLQFLIVASGVFLVRSIVFGYVLAPILILQTVLYSAIAALALLFVQSVLLRWVFVARRAIRFQQLVESSSTDEQSEENQVSYIADLGDLSSTATELINAGIGLAALFALVAIWSPLFPGVSVLQQVVLWSTTGTDETGEYVQTVTLASVLLALLIVFITLQAARKLPALLELILQSVSGTTPGGRYAAATMLNYGIVGIGLLVALSTLGIQWSKLQWLVAALGVGIGFGLQELVANFISGLIIFFERPIRVGDLVTVGESSGTVTKIRIRATTIVDFDRKELLVPNKEFVTGRLLNWSLSDSVNRLMFDVGIAYGSDVGRAIAVLRDTVSAHPRVIEDPPPAVLFNLFGDNALNLSVRVYLDTYDGRLEVLSQLLQAVDAAFSEAGIVIAFPQRDVHFDAETPLTINLNTPGDGR